ncbi:MAG: hypothetical protein EWM47_00705 [Anaerolineaceae bacterium]|nr:MAG: hypothetical protein EWM47_00705 [Anaerolineaceae bacterium]
MSSCKKNIILGVLIIVIGLALYMMTEYMVSAEEEGLDKRIETTPLVSDMMEALSNRQVHPFPTDNIMNQFDLDDFEMVVDTDKAELWLNREWNTLRIRNKNTGYVWGGLPLTEAEGLNKTWNNFGNSIAAIECFDEAGTEGRYGLTENAVTEYTIHDSGFDCYADFKELGISFTISVSLNNNRLTFNIDDASIAEGKDDILYRLKSITFMPFLGASYSDLIDGYMMIPDGSGALIRFQKPTQYASTYAARVFGKDLGIESLAQPSDLQAYRPNDYVIEEPQVLMPIYGIVHGMKQNGIFAVIENGAEYATIVATPALSNNPYNRVSARFEFRQKYNKSINRKKGAGAVVPQEHRNEMSPRLSLYITDGQEAHYDGMAGLYRNILIEKGVLQTTKNNSIGVPIKLEVLGAGLRKEFIGKSLRVFTDVEDFTRIVELLHAKDITNISYVYKSYTKNNEAGAGWLKKLGSNKELESLLNKIDTFNNRFYLYLNPVSANKDQVNMRTEAANNLSNMVIEVSRNNRALMYDTTYYYRLREVAKRMEAVKSYLDIEHLSGLALDELPYRLYGDFTSGKERTRAENLTSIIDLVSNLADNQKLPLYQPNMYLWNYTSEYYNTPLSSGQFLYETDTIPFLQIVLSGSMQMYGSSLNTGSYSKERLLRHIEYGVAPSFTVTHSDSLDLYKTTQEDYISTNYDDWEGYITEAYSAISSALTKVYGQTIIEHTALEDGFIRVTYDNGVKVYVNYTSTEQVDGEIRVQPGWFEAVW